MCVSGGMEEDLWLFRHHTEASSEQQTAWCNAARLFCAARSVAPSPDAFSRQPTPKSAGMSTNLFIIVNKFDYVEIFPLYIPEILVLNFNPVISYIGFYRPYPLSHHSVASLHYFSRFIKAILVLVLDQHRLDYFKN